MDRKWDGRPPPASLLLLLRQAHGDRYVKGLLILGHGSIVHIFYRNIEYSPILIMVTTTFLAALLYRQRKDRQRS